MQARLSIWRRAIAIHEVPRLRGCGHRLLQEAARCGGAWAPRALSPWAGSRWRCGCTRPRVKHGNDVELEPRGEARKRRPFSRLTCPCRWSVRWNVSEGETVACSCFTIRVLIFYICIYLPICVSVSICLVQWISCLVSNIIPICLYASVCLCYTALFFWIIYGSKMQYSDTGSILKCSMCLQCSTACRRHI